MKRKPNPFVHMILWGAGSGFILAMAYIIIILNSTDASGANLTLFELVSNPVLWQLSLYYGALPGAILGVALALNMWNILRKIEMPITEGKMHLLRPEIYATSIALAGVLSFMIIAAMFSFMSLFFFLPPFVAAIVATLIVRHYSHRVVAWSQQIDSQNSKVKNEMRDSTRLQDRLVDAPQVDDMIERKQSLREERS